LQVNLPFAKPLVVLTSKVLLHHRPATSALRDFAAGTFFNRVIDDGKASDNTRHLTCHPVRFSEPLLSRVLTLSRLAKAICKLECVVAQIHVTSGLVVCHLFN
jgi:2-oxoglutarate dehydrogenase complex dehydrogenase (E1) component-like enzyme